MKKEITLINKNIYFIFLGILLILTSCNNNCTYEENQKIPDRIWTWDNKLNFEVNITDTTSINRVFVNIRNDGLYSLSNLYVFLSIKSPNGNIRKDTINLELSDYSGRWYGKGLGDIWDHQILIYDKIKFIIPGKYTFTFEQGTRIEKLQHLLDVGLRIEKIPTVTTD